MALTLPHDLVNLAVLLSTDKLLVLIGKFDLDTHLVLAALDKGDLVNDHHARLDRIVGTVDGKGQVVEADLGLRVGANVGEHSANVGRRGSTDATLSGVGHYNPPRSAVKLTSL